MNKRYCSNCFWGFNEEDERNLEGYKEDDPNRPQAGDCCLGMDSNLCTCSYHEYIDGLEEYETFIEYDETYYGSGYFIITKLDDEIVRFMKISSFSEGESSKFKVIGYEKNLDENSHKLVFKVSSEHPLYEILCKLNKSIGKDKLYSIDKSYGDSFLEINSYLNEASIILNKDILAFNNSTDFCEILLGDNYTCNYYDAICEFYNNLEKKASMKPNTEDLKRLLIKIK